MKIPGHSFVLTMLLLGAALLSGCGGGSVVAIVSPPSTTTTTVTSTGSMFAIGAAVTLTATVSPSAATGTVTFFEGTTPLGTGTLSAGVAAFSVTSLHVGTHSITAQYAGAGSTYAASTSAALVVTIVSSPTTIALAASSASVAAGTPVTFTATVSPADAAGAVTFYEGTAVLGTGTLAGGVASFLITTLTVGTHSVTAVYGGVAPYAGSTSTGVSVAITAIPTTTVLSASATATTPTASVMLTAMVSPAAAAGAVTFYDGATVLGTGALAGGVASFSTAPLAVGTHSITAVYAGGTPYAGSTSAAKSVVITAIATTTVLTTTATATTPTASLTLTATLSPAAATGSVTFADGTATLGTVTVTNGVATLPVTNLSVGTHVITASFVGDATGNYAGSVSNKVTILATAVPTTLTLVSSASTATAGTNVTFTATTSPITATGAVSFSDGASSLGSGTLSAGVATLTTSTLAAGVHFVTASYAGSAVYVASSSNGVAVTINKASTTPISGTFAGPSITGKVMAGSLPVMGASVQFYAAGATGYGIAAGNLIASPVTTDASGSFTIPASYSCPLPATQVYLVATGGITSSVVSAPFEFLSALGSCNALPATVVVNEVTTVSAVWPLAQFLGAGGSIGTNATNAVGLNNAFRIAASLASTTTGISPGASFPARASSPAAKINTLANLLNTCATSNAACQQFFAATRAGPSNTLDAARAVVLNPAANVAALYALAGKSTAYTPVPSTAPADWVLFTVIPGTSTSGTSGVGVLSTGNVWASNFYGGAMQLTPLGGPAFANITGYGQNSAYGLAVDVTDNAWIPNDISNGSVTKLSADGTTGANFSGQGMNYPVNTAVDSDNSVWVADTGNSTLTHLSNAGTPLSGSSGYSIPQINFPTALAIDANHNVWTNNQTGFTVTRVAPDGTNPIVVTCCNGPTDFAIDQRGMVWVTNYYDGGSLSELSSTGTVIASSLKGGGIKNAQAVAVDGAGNLWVANYQSRNISEFAGSQSTSPGTPLSPSVGFAPDGPSPGGFSIAVDASGNVWMGNFSTGDVVRYLGIAAPTKAPLIGLAQAP